MTKLANIPVARVEVYSLFLDQMAFIYKHQMKLVTEFWVGKQQFETLIRQHLRRDNDQPILPITCFFDQILVFIQSGMAGSVFINRNSRYSLQVSRAFLGRSQ